MSEAPTLKRINFSSGQIEVGSEPWFIQTSLSTVRYVEYLKRVPKLTFSTDFKSIYGTLRKIYNAASSGNDMILAIGTARELSWNQLDAIKRFDDNEIPDVIDFCALFINRPGEDIGRFDITLHEQKKALLSKEGYAIEDFFTLALSVIDHFRNAYRKMTQAVKGMQLEEQVQDSQQTSSTS